LPNSNDQIFRLKPDDDPFWASTNPRFPVALKLHSTPHDMEEFEITSYTVRRGTAILPSWVPEIRRSLPVLLAREQFVQIL
jgi:hypothetical protein